MCPAPAYCTQTEQGKMCTKYGVSRVRSTNGRVSLVPEIAAKARRGVLRYASRSLNGKVGYQGKPPRVSLVPEIGPKEERGVLKYASDD